MSNQSGSYSYGIEVYKGINLIYRDIHGQRGSWGADDDNTATFDASEVSEMRMLEYR